MKKIIMKSGLSVTLLCLCMAASPVLASKGVGKAIISIGKVFTAGKDGVEKKLKRRGKVFEGDTIKVGKKSRLQLRFIDNQLVVLKSNTVFRIDEYKFKDKNDQNKSAALSLLKGGMRSVTGLIGKSARDKYKVKTPVATMGVRGTHYLLQVCSQELTGGGQAAPQADEGNGCGEGVVGLVGTVLEGQIEMVNDAGSQLFGPDQFFNVPSMKEAPKTITNPPDSLVSRSETEADEEGETKTADGGTGDGGTGDDGTGGDGTGGDGDPLPTDPPPSDPLPTDPPPSGPLPTDPPPLEPEPVPVPAPAPPPTFIPGTAAPVGAGLVISGISPSVDGAGGGAGIQGGNASIGIATVFGVNKQPVAVSISDMAGTVDYDVLGSGVATEQGGDGMLGVNWGRWASNDIVFNEDSTPVTPLDGVAFVYSDNVTDPMVVAGLTTFLLYDISGAGPSFLDETGAVVTGLAEFGVDFMAQDIDFFASLSGNGRTYSVGSTIIPLSSLMAGGTIPLTGMCTGCPAGITSLTGDAGGVFVGPNAEGFIGFFGINGTDGMGTDIGVSGSGLGIGAGGG